MNIKIGIIDDHQLFLKSMVMMLESFQNFIVVLEAVNGLEMQSKIQETNLPEIILIDVNMPVMDGIATAKWLHDRFPDIKLVALSQNDSDKAVIAMIKAGCCAYLLKDTHPDELNKALNEIESTGFYNADKSYFHYRRLLQTEKEEPNITEKEKIFLNYACSDMTYKQIAYEMKMSERTIDGYRERLFEKLNVQSRVGLALEAIRRELVKL